MNKANQQAGVKVPTGRSTAEVAEKGMETFRAYRAEQLRLEAKRLQREAQEAAALAGL